jgi:transcriptional regulator with XRE-family HTH domain
MTDQNRLFRRISLRSEFQSLFWNIILMRKRQSGFTLKALADALGINKSYVSRSFSSPPNWQIDKMHDMADVLGVDLIVEARDRATGVVFTASGIRRPDRLLVANTSTKIEGDDRIKGSTGAPDKEDREKPSLSAVV